jgi:hypothetical protein
MGGYLDYYGFRDWYETLPQDVQDYLYKSCGYGMGTSSDNLFYGSHSLSHSATRFLCNHATNASLDRFARACNAFMEKAYILRDSAADREYYDAVLTRVTDMVDQDEIDKFKPIILDLIREKPGILQSHIKRFFPERLENIVGLASWSIQKEGLVRREKKGSSFQLWAVDSAKK